MSHLGVSPALTPFAAGHAFLESPRWHAGRLWAIDLFAQTLLRFAPDGTPELAVEVPGTPMGLAWNAEDDALVLCADGRLLVWDGERLRDHDSRFEPRPAPYNELTALPGGGLCAGVFGIRGGGLAHMAGDGAVTTVATGLLLPNGQALTSDGRTLLVAETAGQRITAFPLGDDGFPGSPREWGRLAAPATAGTLPEVLSQVAMWPDGIALDAEDGVWVADGFGHQVLRVLEGGTIADRISTGALACIACALGGDDLRSLFLCLAPDAADPAERLAARAAGIATLRVAVPGAAPS